MSKLKNFEEDRIQTIAARQRARDQLAADVEAFLARGGVIKNIPRGVRTEQQNQQATCAGILGDGESHDVIGKAFASAPIATGRW